jgi:tetratricopeptide (TPR) repeat protein
LAAPSGPEAFATLLESARSAAAATAWAEARVAFEEALALWDRIEDPATVAASTRSGILERAAEFAWYEGDTRRALALNRRAQAEPDVLADPLRHGSLALREAHLLDDLGDLAGEGDAATRAHRLIPNAPPSIDRAGALSRLGLHALRSGRVREAVTQFERATRMAEAIGDDAEVASNLAFLAMAEVDLGDPARPRQVITRLDEMLPRIVDDVSWSIVATWAPWVWIGLGDYPARSNTPTDCSLTPAVVAWIEALGCGAWRRVHWPSSGSADGTTRPRRSIDRATTAGASMPPSTCARWQPRSPRDVATASARGPSRSRRSRSPVRAFRSRSWPPRSLRHGWPCSKPT